MQFHARPVRILSLVVLLAVMNVFVFASGASSVKNNVLLGKLVTNSNRPILVNGGEAITGTNILSGAQLTTSAVSLATVQLDRLGSVMIAPNSAVTLTFDLKSITVKVASGDAIVTTVEGVKGTVISPDGTPTVGSSPAPVPAPAGGSSFNNGDWAGVILGGAGVVFGIFAWKKAGDAQDDAKAAAAAAAAAAASLAAAKACLAGQTASPLKLCTSF